MNKKQIETLQKLLNERYEIALINDSHMGNKDGSDFLPNNPDYIYYKAINDTIEWLGYYCIRDKEGRHKLYKL